MSELVAERLISAVVGDPASGTYQGRLAAFSRRTTPQPFGPDAGPLLGDQWAAASSLIEELRAQRRPSVAIPLYHPPVAGMGRGAEQRDLTAAEAIWLGQIDGPAAASDEDYKILLTLAATVRSPTEKMMVRKALDPIKARYAAKARASALERDIALTSVAPDPTKRDSWQRWKALIGKEILDEIPGITQADAESIAERRVLERWQVEGVEASQRREALRVELGQLLREHDLKSEHFPEAHRWGQAGDPGYAPPVERQDAA